MNTNDQQQLFTVGQLVRSGLLPIQVNPSTIWRWVSCGTRGIKLNSRVVGGRRYIAKADVDAFLAALNDEQPRAKADDRATKLANAVLESAGF